MAATIKDVARRARVSIASVSRTLNHADTVAPEIRERVLRAARSLRYTPHAVARSLISRRTHTVGLVLPDMHGGYFSELIRGVDGAARSRGLHLLVSSSRGSSLEVTEALRSMNGRVDGLLVMSPHVDAATLVEALPVGLPTVLINSRAPAGIRPGFVVDDFGGARSMTAHLAGCGYRRIAHIRGQESHFESGERLRGYQAALTAGGLQPLVLEGDFSEESGYRAGRELAARRERPDAVFAANDTMAIGCLFALTEAGIRVPEDMGLAGFDDVPVARYVSPPLTTVRADVAGIGQRALERLAAAIADPEREDSALETLPVELVVRASCGANSRSAR
ncbi:MAG TPA: LacI family DNA-binding transcriptional regulator [Candidatus Dormibacteraeota bacterium]|nr:LacI family DNA-binding transcriptional regulator [Candidatus Dormibacteraeota bacterium]